MNFAQMPTNESGAGDERTPKAVVLNFVVLKEIFSFCLVQF